MTGPYANAALTYWQAGWRGILPLPERKKANPPTGYTGEAGRDPSYPDIFTWAENSEGAGNIALRLPLNVIGLDVDNYGDKNGGDTLTLVEQQWGPLPATWRSTSRDDGVSGIRLYRVPEGLAWPGEIGAATEIIQHRHRYAVVCPSIHPEGRTYRWLNPAGVVSTSIPDPDELPLLPDTWVEGITGGELATATARNSYDSSKTAAWILTLPGAMNTPCRRMRKAIDQMPAALLGSAHSAGRDGALRVIRLGSEGHAGVVTALADIQAAFTQEATRAERTLLGKRRRTPSEAAKEWADLTTSAANLVTANPSDTQTCDCDGQITGLLAHTSTPVVDGTSALAPDIQPLPAPPPSEQEKHPQEATARLKDGATFILDLPEHCPTVWGNSDEILWAEGEALMIVGPPGVGKTTLTGQLVRARLGLDQSVLGTDVTPTTTRILYLAMDRPQQIARSLRRGFTENDRAVLADRLRVWEGPPPGDVAKNVDILLALARLAEADTIIVDSLKDAAIGLTDDETAAGYNRARQTALAAGIQVLELHHLVKRGINGAKPTTLADVYGSAWLTAGAGSVVLLWGAAGDPIVELVHLKQPIAEVGPWRIIHDHQTGTSSIFHATDILRMAAARGAQGVTGRDVAMVLFDTENPDKAQLEKARRKLNALVDQHRLVRDEGGSGKPAVWRIVPEWGVTGGHAADESTLSEVHEQVHGGHAAKNDPTSTQVHGGSRFPQNRRSEAHAEVHGGHAPFDPHRVTDPPPSIEGGSPVTTACRTCGTIGELNAIGECNSCGKQP